MLSSLYHGRKHVDRLDSTFTTNRKKRVRPFRRTYVISFIFKYNSYPNNK